MTHVSYRNYFKTHHTMLLLAERSEFIDIFYRYFIETENAQHYRMKTHN